MELPDRVRKERYFDPDFYEMEVELLWPRVWQMACRLEEIPSVGDYVTYDILDESIIVVRETQDRIAPPQDVMGSLERRRQRKERNQRVAAGGRDSGPTPLELLSAGLAGCVALYVHRFCVMEGIDGKGIVVEVNPFWKADPGRIARFDVILHLPASVPAHAHAALEAVARASPVHRTFAGTPEMSVRSSAAPLPGRRGASEAVAIACAPAFAQASRVSTTAPHGEMDDHA